jgi:serine/threonine protein phosphatase PrpC
VWDVLSSQEAVEFVFNAFRDKANNGDDILSESVVTSVSDSLVQECLDRGSTDNISVVLVTLSSMSQECFTSCLATVDSDLNLGGITTNLGFTDEDQDVAELQGNIILDPSPPPVNVIKVMADMNQNLPPSSPMKGTRLF